MEDGQHIDKSKNVVGGNVDAEKVHIGDNIYQSSTPKPKQKELTRLPPIDESEVIGRDDDLAELEKMLDKETHLLLMNGLGGIGKTTLAKLYANKYRDKFEYFAWIGVEDNFSTALIADADLRENLGLEFEKGLPEEEQVRKILNQLRNIKGNNLLVIDNAGEQLNTYKDDLPTTNWKVLITSRENLKFKPYRLDILNPSKAIELYRKHHDTNESDEVIEKLLADVGWHTLTIELLAKTASNRNLVIKDMIQMLDKEGLNFSKKVPIDVGHERVPDQTYIDECIAFIFDMSNLEKDKLALDLLMYFSVLPSDDYKAEDLVDFFKIEETVKNEFYDKLNQLVQKGWIDQNKNTYKCHPVVQHVVRQKTKPSWDNCELIVDTFTEEIRIDQNKDNPADKLKWIVYGDYLLKYLTINNIKRSLLQNELGILNRNLGYYEIARDLLKEALTGVLKNFGPDHPDVATSQSNLANVYSNLGDYKTARDLLKEALASALKNFDPNHPYVAISQSNLANVYSNLGDYKTARDLLEAALASALKNFDPNHPLVATNQSNLANVYRELGDYKSAREFLELALDSDLKNFGPEHPNVSVCQSSLGLVYNNLGNYETARDLLKEALASTLKNFGPHHPSVATGQSNLADVYLNLREYETARDLLKDALASDLKNFGAYHPNIATDYNNLAHVYIQMKNEVKAKEYFQKAYNIALKCWGEQHPSTKVIKEAIDYLSK